MRILWHSAVPTVNTGYGRCTREIAGRLHQMGHDIAVKPLGAISSGEIMWHGEEATYDFDEPMKMYSSENAFGLGTVVRDFNDFDADFYFTHFDTWMGPARNSIPNMDIPYGSYVIVDHYPAPNAVIQQVSNARRVVAMSEYAKQALRQKGMPSNVITHGVDTDQYRPLQKSDEMYPDEIRVVGEDGEEKKIDVNDTYIIGMVAANFGDRKHIPAHMEAFKLFLENVDDEALMYIHADANADEGWNLDEVRQEIGIPRDNIIWPSPESYHSSDDDEMNAWYNAFDVFVNCSYGESWGLTITEAMSAETPCIVTNFSSMPEQIGMNEWDTPEELYSGDEEDSVAGSVISHHGIAVNPCVGLYRARVSAKQFVCSPRDIYNAIKYYYDHPNVAKDHGEKARIFARNNYDWERHIVPEFNRMFNNIEEEIV